MDVARKIISDHRPIEISYCGKFGISKTGLNAGIEILINKQSITLKFDCYSCKKSITKKAGPTAWSASGSALITT